MTDYTAEAESGSLIFSCLVFLLPTLVLTISVGIGVIEVFILASTIFYVKPLWSGRHAWFGQARYIVLAFGLNLIVAATSLLWSGFHPRFLESPLKEILIMPVIGLIGLKKPRAEWFWYGLFAGTFGAACIAAYQHFELGWGRAHGFQLAIIFGDIAMAMGLMSLAGIQLFTGTRLAILPYATFIAGLCASLLSGSRGGWLALVLSLIPLHAHSGHAGKRKVVLAAIAGVSLVVAACFIPQLGVRDRIDAISHDIQQYRLGNAATSVGARFEMWKGAWKLFSEFPLTGVGRANFHLGLNELIVHKELNPVVGEFHHAHSEMFNALATEGMVGALTLGFLYAAPLMFFMRRLRHHDACQPYALAGLLLVLSYIDFGLTQVMFAHHVGAAFYAATAGVLAGICIHIQRKAAAADSGGNVDPTPEKPACGINKYYNVPDRK